MTCGPRVKTLYWHLPWQVMLRSMPNHTHCTLYTIEFTQLTHTTDLPSLVTSWPFIGQKLARKRAWIGHPVVKQSMWSIWSLQMAAHEQTTCKTGCEYRVIKSYQLGPSTQTHFFCKPVVQKYVLIYKYTKRIWIGSQWKRRIRGLAFLPFKINCIFKLESTCSIQ